MARIGDDVYVLLSSPGGRTGGEVCLSDCILLAVAVADTYHHCCYCYYCYYDA